LAELRDVLSDGPEAARTGEDVGIVGDHEAALPTGQDPARVEGVAADHTDRAHLAAVIRRPMGLARVLDHVETVPVSDGQDLLEIGRHPNDVEGDDLPRLRGDLLLDPGRVEVEGPRVDIDEYGHGALVEDRLPGAAERVRGRDDLVSVFDPDRVERAMDRRRP